MRLFKKRESAEGAPSVRQKKKRVKKWIVLLVILAAAAALLAVLLHFRGHTKQSTDSDYTYAQAERRDITETLTGSGTLLPADSYNVTTLISGEILSANFEEGDVVSKGDTLYTIDSSDASTSIKRAELALAQSRRNYNDKVSSQADLTITAPISGVVSNLTTAVGDAVGAGAAVATIENTSTLTLTEYYSSEYSGSIYVGQSATVSIPGQTLNLTGKVKEVSSLTRTSDTGVTCFAVTVSVVNPGSLRVGTEATCWLAGGIYPSISDDDGLDASARRVVYADISGTAANVLVHNNETVTAGATIMQLSSDTLSDEILTAADSLHDSELALQSQNDALDDYTIKAPIDGTIVKKYYKAGEKSESAQPLCVIYDLSSLTLTLNVDELDISQVSLNQTATITADAVEGKEYTGVVTRVGVNGTTTNGVTTYPVDIRINDTDGLLPGMNVDVSIIVARSRDTVAIPAGAVERSDRVLVKTKDGSTGDGAPDGFRYADVKTGISDDDYVEILSGIEEGDTVAYLPETAPSSDTDAFGMPMDDSQAGNTQAGNAQTGNAQTGDAQTGNAQTGDTQTGNTQTGNAQTGDTQTGNTVGEMHKNMMTGGGM